MLDIMTGRRERERQFEAFERRQNRRIYTGSPKTDGYPPCHDCRTPHGCYHDGCSKNRSPADRVKRIARIRTSDLKDWQLAYAVAMAEGFTSIEVHRFGYRHDFEVALRVSKPGLVIGCSYRPERDCGLAVSLMSGYRIAVAPLEDSERWCAGVGPYSEEGDTPEEAIARTVVAMKLGDIVEVPA